MDFGAYLRQAREERGISLRQISQSTKISLRALEALERNEIEKLPGGIFTRAFVRAYAAEIGLDPEETVRKFLELFPFESVIEGSPQAVELRRQEEAFQSQSQMARTLFWLVVLSVPVVLVILYVTLRGGGGTRSGAPAARAVPLAAAPSSGIETTAAFAAAPEPAAPREKIPTAPPTKAVGGLAEADQGITLELAPEGPCWVSLRIDGRPVYARLFRGGERDRHRARDEIVLTVGDAGAFRYTVNGRPGRPLGRSGQVVTVRISRATLDEYVVP